MWHCFVVLGFTLGATLQGCGGHGSSTATRPVLPVTMIAGYTNGASAEKVSLAVSKGVNVIFWSFMELRNNTLTGGVKAEAVANVTKALRDMHRDDVLHIVSFGGWNVEHTLTGTCGAVTCTGAAYASAFRAWNTQMKDDVPGFRGFDGIDWDLEGVDNASSASNAFNAATLEIMLSMSDALRKDFLISMVPPQSYFNCRNSGFDLSLRHAADQDPTFLYAGMNAYTALYAKCPDCFDIVMVQIYESFSRAGFELYWDGDLTNVGKVGWPREATMQQETQVVHETMKCLVDGWTVHFNGFWGLPNQTVAVPASKVVIGLANQWAVHPAPKFKVPFFSGRPSGEAWCQGVREASALGDAEQDRVRGFMYWDIHDDTANASLVTDLMAGMSACSKDAQTHAWQNNDSYHVPRAYSSSRDDSASFTYEKAVVV